MIDFIDLKGKIDNFVLQILQLSSRSALPLERYSFANFLFALYLWVPFFIQGHWSMIDLLFTIDRRFFIKLRSSLIDWIYILTMKSVFFHCQKKIKKSIIRKSKDQSYMMENLWLDWKIDFWRLINRSWLKIDFLSESLH